MDKIDEVLTRGVESILPSKKGLADLMKSKKITLYQGFDPSMPSLHLGNYVGVMKLRQFQKLGHKVIFLIGDFTGMIGDPTDKLAARKALTREEVQKNFRTWKKQVERVIDFEGKNKAEILYNSTWNDKVAFKDLIEITSNFTVQQLIERDMYQQRLKKELPIYLHEFLYPVAQGYDCVVMDVDLEIGGSDQLFNMLAGRNLMKTMRGKEKIVLATKLLLDKDGNKVGKTTGNALFLSSSSDEFYAGIMSFPDEVIKLSFELLTEVSLSGIDEKIKTNPLDEKKRLAYEVVKIIWGKDAANKAQKTFEKTFQNRSFPVTAKVIKINDETKLIDIVAGEVQSKSEAKRLFDQNAVQVNAKNVTDPNLKLTGGEEIKIGKKIFVRTKLQ